jgi:hypothetical protein
MVIVIAAELEALVDSTFTEVSRMFSEVTFIAESVMVGGFG